jgi:hypothetical protein
VAFGLIACQTEIPFIAGDAVLRQVKLQFLTELIDQEEDVGEGLTKDDIAVL